MKKRPLFWYFVLAFAISWLIWTPGVAAALGLLDFQFQPTVLTFLGAIGPLLAALIVTGATEGGEGVRNIFRSMFRWRVGARWWAASVLLYAGLFALASVLVILTGGSGPDPVRILIFLERALSWWFSSSFGGQQVRSPVGAALPYPGFRSGAALWRRYLSLR